MTNLHLYKATCYQPSAPTTQTRVMSSDYEYSDDERNFYDEDEDMMGSDEEGRSSISLRAIHCGLAL